ncbi:unnamed protein product [Camellia sinensis]
MTFGLIVLVSYAWKVMTSMWSRPKKLERFLREQGLKGILISCTMETPKRCSNCLKKSKVNLSMCPMILLHIFYHSTIISSRNMSKNSFTWSGPLPRVNVMEPELINEILLKSSIYQKPKQSPLTRKTVRLLVAGLVTYEEDKWAKHRRIMNPAFYLDKLKNMATGLASLSGSCSCSCSSLLLPPLFHHSWSFSHCRRPPAPLASGPPLSQILGPDSGWQRIPLAEVITSAAVKKAYRKATLCVHPDKLQQRGASVQQKYICEKVFDLLKDLDDGRSSTAQFKEKLPWFLNALPSADCAKGGHGAYTSSVDLNASEFRTYHAPLRKQGAVFLVCLVITSSLWSSAIIVLVLAMIVVDLLGVMAILDIQLYPVFVVSHGDRSQRAKEALRTMGSSVFSGITLTKLVGVIVLYFAKSEIFVVLIMFGPPSRSVPIEREQELETSTLSRLTD